MTSQQTISTLLDLNNSKPSKPFLAIRVLKPDFLTISIHVCNDETFHNNDNNHDNNNKYNVKIK